MTERPLPTRAIGGAVRRELSVRTSCVGGDVKDEIEELGPPPPVQGRSQVAILIHGFNNTRKAARNSYQDLFDNLEESLPGIGDDPEGRFRGFHWPGDANLGPVSFVSYPVEIGDAKKSARSLARFLRRLRGPGIQDFVQVDIVAHSLGCRVILETMTELLGDGVSYPVVFRDVCLMAAAVPLYMVDDGAELRPGAELPRRLVVLHSYADLVLAGAFPLGQTLGGEGFFPGALGRYGPPPGLPLPGGTRMPGLGHTKYWKDKAVSSHVATFLNLINIPSREVQTRATLERKIMSEEEGDAND